MQNQSLNKDKEIKDILAEDIPAEKAVVNEMLLPDMTSVMKVQLVASKDRKLWILHDKPFEGILHWIEYDDYDKTVTLVMRDGKSQKTGLKINEDFSYYFKDGSQVYTLLTDGGKIKDVYIVPIVVRY